MIARALAWPALFALALGACTSSAPVAQVPQIPTAMRTPVPSATRDLASTLEPVRSKGRLPALGGAVFQGSKLVAIGATGFQKEGGDVRVTTEARWHLGSDTKAMTAVLVAMQIDRGKLHFEDTLGGIFGSTMAVSPGLSNVTLEQLLQHRGGFAKDLAPGALATMWREASDSNARAHFVARVLADPPAHAPGTFEYSNSSYIVLGAALERVTSKTWEDLIVAELFTPLQMTHCGFGAPEGDSPWGHRREGDELVPVPPGPQADNPPAIGPAGRVHCTLDDWGKFLGVVLAGMRGEETLASAATMKRLLTPPVDAKPTERYAGGWMFLERKWAGGVALTHSGSNTMWLATAWLAPEKNLAFVAATNVFAQRELDAAFAPLIKEYAP